MGNSVKVQFKVSDIDYKGQVLSSGEQFSPALVGYSDGMHLVEFARQFLLQRRAAHDAQQDWKKPGAQNWRPDPGQEMFEFIGRLIGGRKELRWGNMTTRLSYALLASPSYMEGATHGDHIIDLNDLGEVDHHFCNCDQYTSPQLAVSLN